VVWLVVGIVWVKEFYMECPIAYPKEIMLGLILCNWLVVLTVLTTMWCSFDPAGRSWVKMKKYQRSMRESESRFNYKRSGSHSRNWRQRKVIRAYQDSWDHRCRLLFCCMGSSDRSRNSFTEIARLLSDFFRDLDVVPSDVVAGLVLLRKFQILERDAIVRQVSYIDRKKIFQSSNPFQFAPQKKNETYEFLSGVPITEKTHFLALNDARDADHFQDVIHFMYFALGAYGWPMYMKTNSMTCACNLAPHLG
jgi:sn1-specific diacylglycerol lipase